MNTETNTIRRRYTKPAMQVEETPLSAELLIMSGQDKQAQRRGYDALDWDDDEEE